MLTYSCNDKSVVKVIKECVQLVKVPWSGNADWFRILSASTDIIDCMSKLEPMYMLGDVYSGWYLLRSSYWGGGAV